MKLQTPDLLIKKDAYLQGLNPEQYAAATAPIDRPVRVLAGAGTGKTELISRRYIHLLRQLREKGLERPSEKILVLTFTKDAALSMRERISRNLQAHGEDALGPDVWIGNFHQICLRLIRSNPFLVGLPPAFKIWGTLDQQQVMEKLLAQVAHNQVSDLSFLAKQVDMPDAFPSAALSVQYLERGPLESIPKLFDAHRVLAIINRIKTAGLSPREFWETARQQSQLLTRVLGAMPMPDDPKAPKLDRMIMKMQSWQTVLEGWADPSWDMIRNAEEKAELAGKAPTPAKYKEELKELSNYYFVPRTLEPMSPDSVLIDDIEQSENAAIDTLTGLYLLYQDALLKAGACDFDDIINFAIRMLRETPLGAWVRDQFEAVIVDEFQDSNNSQLLLLQALCRSGASNLTVVGDGKQSIYGFRFAQPENLDLVFQGSQPESIHLQTNYRSHAHILNAANFVTTDVLGVSAKQSLLPPSEQGVALEAKDRRVTLLALDAEVSIIEEEDSGFSVIAQAPKAAARKEKKQSEPLDLQREREANFIAVEISNLVENGRYRYSDIAILVQSHGRAEEMTHHLAQFGIPSVRQKTRGFLSLPLCQDLLACLRLLRRPHRDAPLIRLLQKKLNPQQLYSLRKAQKAINSENTVSLYSFLACLKGSGYLDNNFHLSPARHPREGGDPSEQEANNLTQDQSFSLSMDSRFHGNDVTQSLRLSQQIILALADLIAQFEACRPLRMGVQTPAALQRLVEALALIDSTLSTSEQTEQRLQLKTFKKLLWAICETEGRRCSFDALMTKLELYASDPSLDLPITESAENLGDGENAVKILTIHASKGLEFPVVFAAYTGSGKVTNRTDNALLFDAQFGEKNGFGLMLGKIQGRKSFKPEVYRKIWQEPRAIQEHQRVFYVALTRAKERLYVIRGPRSFPWTDPDKFPCEGIRVLSQMHDAELLKAYFHPF